MAALKYKKSTSGYYKVDLRKTFDHMGFLYKPSHDLTVDEATLAAMIEADVVVNVLPAD